jgi:DNA polymerase-3 subunit gamma/tau
MSYQVIARKYRPQRFSDVVGQEHVTQTLSNAITSKRIAHAYLFCGPRGTGKTTVARIFAKCLNCTGGPKAEFDDSDPRCREIAEGRSLDVLEIDGASNRGIEEIRELRETVKYAPASSTYKIYIIDEVHMLTKEAFNALLKTLEEPPAHVKFMFATTEPEKVLPTILSRCQRFDLRRIPVALIVKHLGHIATQEKVKIDDAALYAIARGAEGGMRDAESALDQLISFCGENIVEADVLSMFGLTAQGQIRSVAEGILKGDASTVLHELEDLTRHGKDLGRLLSDLLSHFRNILIYQISKGDLKWLEIPESEGAVIGEQAKTVTTDALTRIMEILTDAEGRLRDAASKKIFLEVALLKAIQARNAVSVDTLLQQLQQLRGSGGGTGSGKAIETGASPTPAPAKPKAAKEPTRNKDTMEEPQSAGPSVAGVPSPAAAITLQPRVDAPAAAPVPAATAMPPAPVAAKNPAAQPPASPAPALSGEALLALWQKLCPMIGQASPFIRSYLTHAHPVSLGKTTFTIGFDPEFADQMSMVDIPKNHQLIQAKLQELGHPGLSVKLVQAVLPYPRPQPITEEAAPAASRPVAAKPANPAGGAQAGKEKPAPIVMNADDFKNDPLIKKALEIFKGQIVEIRTGTAT